jgi:hypothetical protein
VKPAGRGSHELLHRLKELKMENASAVTSVEENIMEVKTMRILKWIIDWWREYWLAIGLLIFILLIIAFMIWINI